jgi:hypothetical protein
MADASRFVYFLFLATLTRLSRTFVKNMTAILNIGPFHLVMVLL